MNELDWRDDNKEWAPSKHVSQTDVFVKAYEHFQTDRKGIPFACKNKGFNYDYIFPMYKNDSSAQFAYVSETGIFFFE